MTTFHHLTFRGGGTVDVAIKQCIGLLIHRSVGMPDSIILAPWPTASHLSLPSLSLFPSLIFSVLVS